MSPFTATGRRHNLHGEQAEERRTVRSTIKSRDLRNVRKMITVDLQFVWPGRSHIFAPLTQVLIS